MTEPVFTCCRCGERIWRDDNAGDENTPLCQSCYDRCYTSCDRCGRIIHTDDAFYGDDDEDSPLCYACHTQHAGACIIHDYPINLLPSFTGKAAVSLVWSWR